MQKTRVQVIVIIGVVLVTLMLLASSIERLEFRPAAEGFGISLAERNDDPFAQDDENALNNSGESLSTFAKIVRTVALIFIWILLPLSILYTLLTKEGRRNFWRSLGAALFWGLSAIAFIVFWPKLAQMMDGMREDNGSTGFGLLSQWRDAPLPVVVGISFLLALILIGVGWFVWRQARKLRFAQEQVAAEARTALANLDAGESLRDVIIRCYVAMGDAAREQRGIQRQVGVTPREFEQRLINYAGLPESPVKRLTRLFEQVRYGAHSAGDGEKKEAQACLQAIIAACEVAR